jgi:signal transduction histidine kinase
MIDLIREGDRIERVGFRHVDAECTGLLARPESFRADDLDVLPIADVLESGVPYVFENIERDWRGSDLILERLRRLKTTSLIIVPLEANGRRMGALTLGSTRTDRHFVNTDISLAWELARSSAMALANASLYADAGHAIAARDEVLAVVSHDLRNPVSRIGLAADLVLETEPLSQQGQKAIAIISRAAHEMNRLIGDLLDVSRIQSGNLSIDAKPFEIATLLERVDESFAILAQQRSLGWRVDVPTDSVSINADQDRLVQALGNLVGNAMKFTPSSGLVRVDAHVSADAVRIGVHDTGPGMDENQLAHVFDRFWQVRSGDRRGAGLGLAIAPGIVLAHDGRLWLESTPGSGTSAWIELPLRSNRTVPH